jgi:hypothetical protein
MNFTAAKTTGGGYKKPVAVHAVVMKIQHQT